MAKKIINIEDCRFIQSPDEEIWYIVNKVINAKESWRYISKSPGLILNKDIREISENPDLSLLLNIYSKPFEGLQIIKALNIYARTTWCDYISSRTFGTCMYKIIEQDNFIKRVEIRPRRFQRIVQQDDIDF